MRSGDADRAKRYKELQKKEKGLKKARFRFYRFD